MKINGTIEHPRWYDIHCCCGVTTEDKHPIKECLHCKFEQAESSLPKEDFKVDCSIYDENGIFVEWGFNSRLDNLQAAILNYKLSYYDEEVKRRREIAGIYQKELDHLKEILLPPGPDSDENYFDVFQNYEIEAERRDLLKKYLSENGVGTIIQWNGQPVHSIVALGFKGSGLPYTEEMYKKCLMLPMNTSLSNQEVIYVCNKIKNFYE